MAAVDDPGDPRTSDHHHYHPYQQQAIIRTAHTKSSGDLLFTPRSRLHMMVGATGVVVCKWRGTTERHPPELELGPARARSV